MPLIFPYREKTFLAVSEATLSPIPGRSFKVNDIEVVTTQTEDWALLKSGLSSIGYFSVGDIDHNHLALFPDISNPESLRHFLQTAEFVPFYPVIEGDPFTVKLANAATLIKITYEEYDAAEMKAVMPNGKASDQLLLNLYGTNLSTLTAEGWLQVDKMLNPKEFANFPFEAVVPTGRSFKIHALAGLDISHNSYTGSANTIMNTKHCRLTLNREILYDTDMKGFYMKGAGAANGSVNTKVNNGNNQIPYMGNKHAGGFFLLPQDLVCNPGDELGIDVYIDGTFGVFPANTLRVCLICTMMKV